MEKEKRITLGPRADGKTKSLFVRLFGTANSGAEYVVQSWPGLYRRSLFDLLKELSVAERSAIIDSYNGTAITPWFAGIAVSQHVADSIELEGLAAKWEFDGPALVRKLDAMRPFDSACLEVWACGFWEQVGTPEEVPLERYIDPRSLV